MQFLSPTHCSVKPYKKKYPCRKERGIKQRQDGEKRQGEKLGRSHGNQRGSKRKLVFKRGSRFMHV